ncbi:hypothetical protein GWI33_002394 [Rhynchophorus ferrugineus]|uniref:Uncharacterized protein n=1 Tax=Rhynchophorus ferrugineus TaxID=354439 RepID=A0A834IKI6_RHYFE|nr:hypothetical protein GWI33_002394 [Rhynchophorus ferrugineus]
MAKLTSASNTSANGTGISLEDAPASIMSKGEGGYWRPAKSSKIAGEEYGPRALGCTMRERARMSFDRPPPYWTNWAESCLIVPPTSLIFPQGLPLATLGRTTIQ